MKLHRVVVMLALMAVSVSVFATTAGTADELTGKWSLAVQVPGETVDVTLELKQAGEEVSGTMTSSHASGKVDKGNYKEKKLSLVVSADIQGSPTPLQVDGTVDGDKMTGSITAQGLGTFPFSGTRSK